MPRFPCLPSGRRRVCGGGRQKRRARVRCVWQADAAIGVSDAPVAGADCRSGSGGQRGSDRCRSAGAAGARRLQRAAFVEATRLRADRDRRPPRADAARSSPRAPRICSLAISRRRRRSSAQCCSSSASPCISRTKPSAHSRRFASWHRLARSSFATACRNASPAARSSVGTSSFRRRRSSAGRRGGLVLAESLRRRIAPHRRIGSRQEVSAPVVCRIAARD